MCIYENRNLFGMHLTQPYTQLGGGAISRPARPFTKPRGENRKANDAIKKAPALPPTDWHDWGRPPLWNLVFPE
jgi:hypothetical protein